MTQPTHISLNGVKRSRRSTSKTSTDGRESMSQDTFDGRQVDVCNTRSKVRIATWNGRTMHQPQKLGNMKKEGNRMNLDILVLADVRWLK